MEFHEVIIIGGGPAGSTCAWKLKRSGIDCTIIDKTEFPRIKLCAGWITPDVIRDLEIDPTVYPFGMLRLPALYASFFGIPVTISSPQFSIRRYEFDHWLLKRASVPVKIHDVKHIDRQGDNFFIDELFSCKYLVGAGGTHCPVYKKFFSKLNPRNKNSLIVCRELELQAEKKNSKCHLWFFENKLAGYSWYVPKTNDYLNIGVGGVEERLRRRGDSINTHWDYFIDKLKKRSMINGEEPQPKGHSYYLRERIRQVQDGNIYIIGDSAGLATRDMGEGIGPAVQSGILAAESIISGNPYNVDSISSLSLHHPVFTPILKKLFKC